MRNPFRRAPEPPRLVKRIEQLEINAADVEDTIEKVLYQQQRILGKVNARHKRELKDAEIALDGPEAPPPDAGGPERNGSAVRARSQITPTPAGGVPQEALADVDGDSEVQVHG